MPYNNYNVKIALWRGNIYGFLTEAFIRLPNEEFIQRITSSQMQTFLEQLHKLDHAKVRKGVGMTRSYLNAISAENIQRIMDELAVDRTRLIRSAGKGKLRAPYEGLYKKKEDAHTVILNVKKFYKRIGIAPTSYANDSPDFFCTELDFMKQLCLLEADAQKDFGDMRTIEREFLTQHLGSWIGDYCSAAGETAMTSFYRGLLLILESFVELEQSHDN
ncbi:MAG: putative component of anaerobic dehydrogenase [Bacillota bacterium]|jgi:TorA maturation chaperone TorD|nr:putative component of anaerobic dehydrogenase [Bacillota bacterium]